ncbi:MAG: hypothetical protein OJJ21_11820 [Ferrovibrio sp.]|uniref:hypothetical protein n=1 Tax=Ferrovibrio sp. TaxID=1917215 RepID=UPI00260D2668|nr:hypothetical protein [Ferrovibrio sp.]MCW0234276.1 hypothetical protein [Ferrovibrio sp.]
MNQMAVRRNTDLDRAIATITQVAGNKPDWRTVAITVEKIRKDGSWRDRYASPSEWLSAAAAAYDVHPNTMRRFITVTEFVREKLGAKAVLFDPAAGEGSLPRLVFGTVELIKRLHDISPDEADKALAKHQERKLSFREMQRWYENFAPTFDTVIGNPPYLDNAYDSKKISSKRAHAERSGLAGLIQSHIEMLSGNDTELEATKIKFDYVNPDAVVIGRKGGAATFVDAFSLKRVPAGAPRTHLTKLVSEIAFASTFFRRYWLLLDAPPKDVTEIGESISDLALKNVGIAEYISGKQDNLNLRRSPSGNPVPDRQEKPLEELASKPL